MIYLIVVIFVSIFALLSTARRDYGPWGYFIVFILALFAGLRYEVGAKPDWNVYYSVFNDAPFQISDLFTYFSNNSRIEKGYLLYNYVIHSIVDDFNFFLVITATLTIGLTYKSISFYTPMTFLALLIYMRYGYFQFNMMFLRQGLAVAIFVYSIQYIHSKQYFKYILLNVIAVTFHVSLLVAFPLIFIIRSVYRNITLLTILLLSIVFEYIGGIKVLADYLPSSNIILYAFKSYIASGEPKPFSFSFVEKPVLFFILLYFRELLMRKFEYFNVLFNLSFIGLILSVVFYQFEDLSDRFVIIFNVSNVILLTYLSYVFSKEGRVLYISLISFIVIYFVFKITNAEQYTPYNLLGLYSF